MKLSTRIMNLSKTEILSSELDYFTTTAST